MPNPPATISAARFPADLETVRTLFREYIDSLDVDLSFQDFETELADLPGKYVPPRGMVLIARDSADAALGCIALRPLHEPGACEMKRLYVRPAARGQDLGRRLAEAIIAFAGQADYERMVLDTLATMQAARRLYASLGFQPTAPYYDNPLPGAQYLTLDLRQRT